MSINHTIRRIYRETIASYGDAGIGRAEAIEAAAATVMVEVNAGRLSLDFEQAVRAELRKADEADGRDADTIINRLSRGQVPITEDDLDVVVTLGKGLRKVWREVTGDDLVQLGTGFQQAVQLLSDFYKSNGATDPAPVLDALRSHLESVAHHHINVAGFSQPELDFAP